MVCCCVRYIIVFFRVWCVLLRFVFSLIYVIVMVLFFMLFVGVCVSCWNCLWYCLWYLVFVWWYFYLVCGCVFCCGVVVCGVIFFLSCFV